MADKSADQPLEGRCILIVEDEYLIATDIVDAVERLGGSAIGPCADVAAAQRALADAKPDGAVLDLKLKGGKATELAREIDSMGIAIMYHTGYDTTAADESLPQGILALKPLNHDTLMRHLANALGSDCKPA